MKEILFICQEQKSLRNIFYLQARLGSLTWPIVRDKVDAVVTVTGGTGGRTQGGEGTAARERRPCSGPAVPCRARRQHPLRCVGRTTAFPPCLPCCPSDEGTTTFPPCLPCCPADEEVVAAMRLCYERMKVSPSGGSRGGGLGTRLVGAQGTAGVPGVQAGLSAAPPRRSWSSPAGLRGWRRRCLRSLQRTRSCAERGVWRSFYAAATRTSKAVGFGNYGSSDAVAAVAAVMPPPPQSIMGRFRMFAVQVPE